MEGIQNDVSLWTRAEETIGHLGMYNSTGLHLHEIRHIGQSIKAGGLSLNSNGQLLNAAKDKSQARDFEVEAYQAGYSYDGQYPGGASSLNDINEVSLMDIKFPDGTPVYEEIKD